MAKYIDRDAFITQERAWYCKNCIRRMGSTGKTVYEIGETPCLACHINDLLDEVENCPAADVVEWKTCKNVAIEYDDCDQFMCSECGIELQDWRRVERDEDGLEVYHDYRLRFCPNCGSKINGGDEDEDV